MYKKIKELSLIINKIHNKNYNNIIFSISGKDIYYNKDKLNTIESKLFNFINNDYYDAGLNYIQAYKDGLNNFKRSSKKIKIYNDLNKYLKLKGIYNILDMFFEDEIGYFFSISLKGYCSFTLSGLLQYYIIDTYFNEEEIKFKRNPDKKIEKILEQFFIERGYKKLTKELGEKVLDIDGEDLHTIKKHKELQLELYNKFYGEDEYYFNGENGIEKVNSKNEDLEKFLLYDYEGEFKVKNLLFGECFKKEIVD